MPELNPAKAILEKRNQYHKGDLDLDLAARDLTLVIWRIGIATADVVEVAIPEVNFWIKPMASKTRYPFSRGASYSFPPF